MRRFLTIALLLIFPIGGVLAQKTVSQLQTENTNTFPTGCTNCITPAAVSALINDIINSFFNTGGSGGGLMGASGMFHASGIVPDPGAIAGTTRFLREDATWAVPPGGGGGGTPGGSTSQIQWNSGGAFAGTSQVTTDGSNLLLTAIATPATPASGLGVIYENTVNKILAFKNDAGTISGTVIASSALSHQFANALGAGGSIFYAQPAFGDLSGAIGSTSQIAFNSAGTEAGVTGSVVSPNFSLTLGGQTVTASDPVLNISQTWNSGSVAFTGNKFNITNTASAASSIVFDSQVGGISQFQQQISGIVNIANSTNPGTESLRVYNTVDVPNAPINYERGVLDWTASSNVLSIGTQNGGSGTGRDIQMIPASGNIYFGSSGSQLHALIYQLGGANANMVLPSGGMYTWVSTASVVGIPIDTGTYRAAAGVVGFANAVSLTPGGWFNYAGQNRVTADALYTSNTTLGTVTGLSVALAAGRTYGFDVYMNVTDAPAAGIQTAMSGSGGLTATAVEYDGWVQDSNAIKGMGTATALGTVVASSITANSSGIVVQIRGTITVNAAGNLNVQAAQTLSNATATTIKRGSRMIIQDMP